MRSKLKHLFVTLPMMLVALMASGQSCPDKNHPHAIDLGLPSGTKWACCNVGTTTPESYGSYYAWGEKEEKEKYDWTTYIHCDGSMKTCQSLGSDIAGTEYDVAHVKWGGFWVMPSKDQFQELIDKCSYTGTIENGVEGGLLTGPSGGTIFLPTANIRWNGFLECLVLGGYYWSSTQSPSSYEAYRLCFELSWGGSCGIDYRALGLPVRPVISGTSYRFNNETNNIIHEKSFADDTIHAIYNICGIKVNDAKAEKGTLSPGIYIINGRKVVVK